MRKSEGGSGGGGSRQRPPWRHLPLPHADSEEEDLYTHAVAASPLQERRHLPISLTSSSAAGAATQQPLRPPPLFHSHVGGDGARLAASAAAPALLHTTKAVPTHVAGSRGRRSHLIRKEGSPSVPVSHWRRDSRSASSIESAEEDAADAALHCTATVEHYHVLELEEQLQYWRERALRVEGLSLQRERAIKEKYAADFAAAQATSEGVIRRLLDKQERLRWHQQQRETSSRSVSARSSTASSSSSLAETRFSRGNTAVAAKNAHREGERRPRAVGSSSSAATERGVKEASGVTHEKEARALQQRVEDLSAANAHLVRALAAAENVKDNSRDTKPNLSEDVRSAAEHRSHRAPYTVPAADAAVVALARTLLRCLEHSAELRQSCLASLHDGAENTRGDDGGHGAALAAEAAEHRRVTHLLSRVLRLSSSALEDALDNRQDNFSSASSTIVNHLTALNDAAEHLDLLLVTCTDDVVLLQSRYEDKASGRIATQPPQPHENESEGRIAAQLRDAQRIIDSLRSRVKSYEASLQEQTQLAQQQAHAHAAELNDVREGFTEELTAAARRVSAAEHDCHLHVEEAALWRQRLAAVEKTRDAYARECTVQQRRLELLQLRLTNVEHSSTKKHQYSDASTTSEAEGEERRSKEEEARPSAAPAHNAATKPALISTLRRVDHIPDASPLPRGNHPWLEQRRTARDMHADATTPRRSLSYSPPEKAETSPDGVVGKAGGKNGTSERVSLGFAAGTRSAGSGRVVTSGAAASASAPMYVVQPSRVVGGRGEDGAWSAHKPEEPRAMPPSVSDASTPLARMRAWEEKFRSILTPS